MANNAPSNPRQPHASFYVFRRRQTRLGSVRWHGDAAGRRRRAVRAHNRPRAAPLHAFFPDQVTNGRDGALRRPRRVQRRNECGRMFYRAHVPPALRGRKHRGQRHLRRSDHPRHLNLRPKTDTLQPTKWSFFHYFISKTMVECPHGPGTLLLYLGN